MTAKHTGHASVRGNVEALIDPGEATIAGILKNAGYRTACIGKWGVGHPPPPKDPHRNGFDLFFGYLSMWHAHNYYPEFLWKNRVKVPLGNVVQHPADYYMEGQGELTGLAIEKVEYSPDLFTREALSYIENRDSKKPFFLFLAYTIPHANNEALRFGEHGMEVPDLGIYRDKEWPDDEKGKAAMITRLDRDVGRILDRLVELDLAGSTLVIFSSDNGPHREGGVDPEFFDSNGSLRGIKRDLYEGGVRVPMIAWWPDRIAAASICDHVSAFWDVLPTLAELVGASIPDNIDGISFLPALMGREQPDHDYLYWEFHEGSSKQAIRKGNWKGVRVSPSDPIELYNLTTDIGEEENVAARHPGIIEEFERILSDARTDAEVWPLKD
jgi:arylsulfatase A-like enzyme